MWEKKDAVAKKKEILDKRQQEFEEDTKLANGEYRMGTRLWNISCVYGGNERAGMRRSGGSEIMSRWDEWSGRSGQR